MLLVFLGLGYTLKHLTLEAVNELKTADVVYIDTYTSVYGDPIEEIKRFNPNAKYIYAFRRDLEGPFVEKILEEARSKKIIIAVPGDPFIATTHDAIWINAIKRGIEVKVVNGLSFITLAYSRLGLQSYKFGKHVTLIHPSLFKSYSTIDAIYSNLERNLHTIVLLDLRVEEDYAMTISEAVKILLELDYRGQLGGQMALGVARLGWVDEKICARALRELSTCKYPPPPHSLVILSPRLDAVEEEFVKMWFSSC
ncbi:MAG: diphthine synthase [Desulfurococcaceae archaeon]|jgi:diphthine synthase|nr:diphthine synthase [Desulfurococcaceae archaeon]